MIGMQRIRSLMSSWTPRRLAVGALALGILGSGWLLVTRGLDLSPAAVRTMLADLGVWGPLALVAGLSAVLVVPIVPASLLQIGAGLAFGPLLGLIAVCVADILGASAGYWIARAWGDALLARWLARLIPGPAYPLVSFAAGASPLGFGAYLAGSFLGVLPGLVLLVYAGDLALRSPLLAFVVTVAFVGSLALAGRMLGGHTPEQSGGIHTPEQNEAAETQSDPGVPGAS